ncbi:MAG: DUF342 domain-containing protein [Lachnospiraceae bacterium]|nr:DUF342 domain-containing protein [Lachnospiraceae bacterium]
MTALTRDDPKVRFSNDSMKAFLYLPRPDFEGYNLDDITEILRQSGISYGIKEQKVRDMIEQQIYNQEVLIAEGDQAVDGIDGYYDYKFDMNFSKKPKVRPDGSVDYWSIKMVEMVTEGQVIAEYHKAVQGKDGMNLKGKPVLAKRGRDLVPLKGKGFERSEDGLTYTSLMDGKIDKNGDRIVILPVYEINGDADLNVGNIDFRGDVIIHGSICSGLIVKATGTVTVDGIVEGASIEAGKDIVLRSGVMGASRAVINSKGNISAKFFEYTRVHANGTIQADVFLNCQVSCGESIILNGRKASIIGGEVGAIQSIEADILGSDGEVSTNVKIGNDLAVRRRIGILQNKIQVEKENLAKIEEGLKILQEKKNDPRRTDLLRVKIRDTALLAGDTAELEKLEDQVARAKGGTIRVNGYVYPGVCVEIDELRVLVKEKQKRLEFVRKQDRILMCALEA